MREREKERKRERKREKREREKRKREKRNAATLNSFLSLLCTQSQIILLSLL